MNDNDEVKEFCLRVFCDFVILEDSPYCVLISLGILICIPLRIFEFIEVIFCVNSTTVYFLCEILVHKEFLSKI